MDKQAGGGVGGERREERHALRGKNAICIRIVVLLTCSLLLHLPLNFCSVSISAIFQHSNCLPTCVRLSIPPFSPSCTAPMLQLARYFCYIRLHPVDQHDPLADHFRCIQCPSSCTLTKPSMYMEATSH